MVETYEDLVVLGFPSREFGKQEYAKDQDISTFLESTFEISESKTPNVKILARTTVNGEEANPIWRWLATASGVSKDTRWNFATKFVVDRSGEKVLRFDGRVVPMDLKDQIETFLNVKAKNSSSSL